MKTKFQFYKLPIEGLMVIQPFVDEDERGYFSKTFEKSIFAEHGIKITPWEELQSFSKKGTLRGLHFQREYSQDKLVRVLHGEVYDVAVDLRKGSPTFGKWHGEYLSAENRKLFYVPKGFAHGFLALSDDTLFTYLCGDRYDPETEGGILWNDPQLSINWPLDHVDQVILKERDKNFPTLKQFVEQYGALTVDDR